EVQGAAPAEAAVTPQDLQAVWADVVLLPPPTFQLSFHCEGEPPLARHTSVALPCCSSSGEGGRTVRFNTAGLRSVSQHSRKHKQHDSHHHPHLDADLLLFYRMQRSGDCDSACSDHIYSRIHCRSHL
ncbi:hypothetical protein D4764_0116000, partial [Takifugu flavidus]